MALNASYLMWVMDPVWKYKLLSKIVILYKYYKDYSRNTDLA